MNIVCFRCDEKVLSNLFELNSKDGKIVLIMDEWDIANVKYNSNILDNITKIYKIKSIDSIEELATVYVDLSEEYDKFDLAISGTEYSMFAAGYFNALINNDFESLNMTIATRDKRYMKQKFDLANLNFARYKSSYSLVNLERGEYHGLRYPVVAKPVTGLGCYNTCRLENETELKDYFKELTALPFLKADTITLEEFVVGDEYHLDCIINNGICTLFVISKYFIPRLSLTNNAYNSRYLNGSYIVNEADESELYHKLRSQFNKLLQVLNIKNGITHTEFFIDNNNNIYFSEIAKRYAGGYILNTINQAFNIDLIEEWLKAELNHKIIVPKRTDDKFIAWLGLTPDEEGIVSQVPSVDEYLALPWIKDAKVSLRKGDKFSFDNPSLWGISVVIESDDKNDFMDKIKRTYDLLPIKVDV